MALDIAVYDANEVNVIIDGVVITGFADGDFVKFAKDEDIVIPHVSAKGDVGVAINHHGTGKITITLNQTSSAIEPLMAIARERRMVSAWVISNNTVKEKAGGTQAQFIKIPEGSFGREITNREFVISVYDYEQ